MREEKYAHVLDDDWNNRKQKDESKEEELSITREIKFQNVQDENEEETEEKKYLTRQIKYQKLQDNIDQNRVKKDFGFKDRDIEKTKPQVINDDDLYLTTSFKPLKKRFRLKKVFKVIFVLIFLVCLGGAFYFFIAKPVYNKLMQMMPEEIFHSSINTVRDYAITFLEDDLMINDKEYFDMQIGVDSNLENLDVLNNQKFGFTFGVDATSKKYEFGTYVLKSNNKYGYSVMTDDTYAYLNFWGIDTILKLDTEEYDMSEDLQEYYSDVQDEFANIVYLTQEDKEYLVNKIALELNNLITRDNVKVEKDELTIMGNTKSVVRNTLSFDKDSMEKFEEELYGNLKNDTKFVEILANFLGIETNEIGEYLKVGSYADSFKLEFNIYTIKGTEFVGFDIVSDGFRSFYYYVDGDNFNLHINLTSKENLCEEGKDCTLDTQSVYDFMGSVEDNHKKIVVTRNGLDFATIILREFSKNKIDFDIEYLETVEDTEEDDKEEDTSDDEEKEKIVITVNIDMQVGILAGEVTFKNEERNEYFKIDLDMETSGSKDIAVIDEEKVVLYSGQNDDKILDDFASELEEQGVDELFWAWDDYVDLFFTYLETFEEALDGSSNDEVTTV